MWGKDGGKNVGKLCASHCEEGPTGKLCRSLLGGFGKIRGLGIRIVRVHSLSNVVLSIMCISALHSSRLCAQLSTARWSLYVYVFSSLRVDKDDVPFAFISGFIE